MGNRSFKPLSIDEFLEVTSRPDFLKLIKKEHNQLVAVKLPGTIAHFSKPENSSKNRSKLYPCWDRSRVILRSPDKGTASVNDITSTYINANFVDGFEHKNKFICTQSPLENTWEDFWRMVLQENSHIIVSATKINDVNEYCYDYWVNNNYRDKVFGRYVIKTLEFIEEKAFIRARLQLIDAKNNISREIHYFWYTNWPLHYSWPINALELLNLILQVNQKRKELKKTADSGPGPIVIHCSEGLNWAGIFCTIDISLSQVRKKEKVSLPRMALKVRKQRHSCISCFVEYEICYSVLWEAILRRKMYVHGNYDLFSLPQIEVALVNYFFGESYSDCI